MKYLVMCAVSAVLLAAPAHAVSLWSAVRGTADVEVTTPIEGILSTSVGYNGYLELEDGKTYFHVPIRTRFEYRPKYYKHAWHGFWVEADYSLAGRTDRVGLGTEIVPAAAVGTASGGYVFMGGGNFPSIVQMPVALFPWLATDSLIFDGAGGYVCVGHCELVAWDRRKKEWQASGIFLTSGQVSIAAVPLPAAAGFLLISLGCLAAVRGVVRGRA
jgi:opacity protein-like surface antigen